MAPYASKMALAFACAMGYQSGDSFFLQDSWKSTVAYSAALQSRRRARAAATPATCLAARTGETREGNDSGRSRNSSSSSSSYEYVLGQTAADTEGGCRRKSTKIAHAELIATNTGEYLRPAGCAFWLASFHCRWVLAISNF